MSRSPVARYFDEVAESYAARYDDQGPAGQAFAIRWQRIFEQLGRPSGRILDAGCGPGVFLAAIGGRGSWAGGEGGRARGREGETLTPVLSLTKEPRADRSPTDTDPAVAAGSRSGDRSYRIGDQPAEGDQPVEADQPVAPINVIQPSAFSLQPSEQPSTVLQPFGLDLSPKMVVEAARRAPEARVAVGALDHMPYRDGRFDWVVAMGAIEYVPDDWRAVAELVRVLRPGGRILATFPNWWSPYRIWKGSVFYPIVDRLRPVVYRLRGRPVPATVTAHHHAYREGEIRARFAALGCPVEDLVYLNVQVVPSPFDEWFPALSVGLSRRLESRGRGPLRWFGTAMLVSARRSAPDPGRSE